MTRHPIDAHAGRWWPWHPRKGAAIAAGRARVTVVVPLLAESATFAPLARAHAETISNAYRPARRSVCSNLPARMESQNVFNPKFD